MKRAEWIKNIGLVTMSVVVSVGVIALGRRGEPQNGAAQPYGAGRVSYEAAMPQQESKSVADVAESLMPSVVGIASGSAAGLRGKAGYDQQQQWSMGSGIIVTENGYILTNQHVVGNPGTKLIVTLSDGATAEASHVWSDASLDLALIKIGGTGYPTVTLGDVNTLRVGEQVLAIGNPLSMQFQHTVTGGLISAVNRTVSLQDEDGNQFYMDGMIQTDASINPGNSGGPLVNVSGEVIGINTVKVTSAEGIGFAVPINIARPIIEAYENGKTFAMPYLGIDGQDNASGRFMGAPTDADTGVIVNHVEQMSPAAWVGLRQGDIITHVNKHSVNTMMELREELFRTGKECILTYISKHAVREVRVQLEFMK